MCTASLRSLNVRSTARYVGPFTWPASRSRSNFCRGNAWVFESSPSRFSTAFKAPSTSSHAAIIPALGETAAICSGTESLGGGASGCASGSFAAAGSSSWSDCKASVRSTWSSPYLKLRILGMRPRIGPLRRQTTVTTAAGQATAETRAETNCIQSMVTLQKQALVTWVVTCDTKNKGLHRCKPLFYMVPAPGIEPGTY